jgi:lysozyme
MTTTAKNKLNKKATWLALAIPLVGGFEGLRQWTYRDPVGIPTYCYGETQNAVMGKYTPLEECKALLASRLIEFNEGVERCVKRPMNDGQRTAFVSLAYNIGTGAFCKSTAVRRFNDGDEAGACDAILRFNKAGGKVWTGLQRRREAERKLCLKKDA